VCKDKGYAVVLMKKEVRVLLRCFFRSYLIGAAYNTKGLQNLGLLYVMEPGLRLFYKDHPRGYMEARKRYLDLYNSHPYFLPFLVGYFLFLESRIAQGLVAPDGLKAVKQTSAYTLSAIGDSFFGGSLFVFWSLVEVLFILYGMHFLVLLWPIIFFVLLQLFRFFLFWRGWKRGLSFLQGLKALDLVSWSHWIKILNAFLLVLIWKRLCLFSPYPHILLFFSGGICLGIMAFVGNRYDRAREFLVIGGIVFLIFFYGFWG